jgi:hypothetical protein
LCFEASAFGFTRLALAAEPGTVEDYPWMGGSNEGTEFEKACQLP